MLNKKTILKNWVLIVLLFFAFIIIFYNLGKKDLGHYREESHSNTLPKTLNWETYNNNHFNKVMHYHFQNYHEYRYSTIAQEILETGVWSTLRVKNFDDKLDYFHKGPIYFWLTAGISKIIGFSKFSVRFWPAFMGFAVIILTYLVALKTFDKKVALWSMFILSTSFQFVYVDGARAVSMDTVFLFFITLAFYLLLVQDKNKYLFFISTISLVFAGLTRSVLMIFPLLISFFILDFIIDFKKIKIKYFFKKWLIGLVLVLFFFSPWIIIQNNYFGEKYFNEVREMQFKAEFLNKVVLAIPEMYDRFQYSLFLNERPSDNMFYLMTIYKGFFPWSIFVILALIYYLKFINESLNRKQFAVIVMGFAIFLFALIKEQNWVRYMINLYPFLAIILAKFIADFQSAKYKDFFMIIGLFITIIFFSNVLIPFNINNGFNIMYNIILFGLFFLYFIFREERIDYRQKIATIILVHFGLVAIINILQPYIYG